MKMWKKFVNQLRKHWIFISILVIFSIWVVCSYFFGGLFHLLVTADVNAVVDFIKSFGFLAVVIFVLLVILECVLAPIPPFVLYVAGGMIFGAFIGGILTLIGNVIGATIAFLIARKYGRGIVEKKINPVIWEQFDKFSQKYGGWALFLLRLNPFTTSDLFSYLAGLTKMKLRTLIISTSFGLIPLIYIQTYLGEFFIKDSPILWLIFLIVCLIYLAVFLYGLWYLIKKRDKNKLLK